MLILLFLLVLRPTLMACNRALLHTHTHHGTVLTFPWWVLPHRCYRVGHCVLRGCCRTLTVGSKWSCGWLDQMQGLGVHFEMEGSCLEVSRQWGCGHKLLSAGALWGLGRHSIIWASWSHYMMHMRCASWCPRVTAQPGRLILHGGGGRGRRERRVSKRGQGLCSCLRGGGIWGGRGEWGVA